MSHLVKFSDAGAGAVAGRARRLLPALENFTKSDVSAFGDRRRHLHIGYGELGHAKISSNGW